MSNEKKETTNVWERITKLWFSIGKMLMDGVRDPEKVADVLQTIVNMKVYLKQLFVVDFGSIVVVIYELVKDATLEQIFEDFGPNRRRWEDNEEILAFANQHKGRLGKNGNFFEREDGFVAHVIFDVRGPPCVNCVYPLSYVSTWDAKCQHRVFYPQQ